MNWLIQDLLMNTAGTKESSKVCKGQSTQRM